MDFYNRNKFNKVFSQRAISMVIFISIDRMGTKKSPEKQTISFFLLLKNFQVFLHL